MDAPKVRLLTGKLCLTQHLAICLVLGIVVVVQLLVATNPDATLPAMPELMGIALLSSILCLTFSVGRTLQLPSWSCRRIEIAALSLVGLTVLGVTGPRAVVSLFRTPSQAWTPCWSLPGKALKLECFLQASITQNYGVRTFFMLFVAAMLGTLAFLIARSVSRGWTLLLGAVVFGPLLVTVVGFFCLAFGIEQVLPESLLYNAWGRERLTQIFSNPGWVWPYFAPGLAIVLWATVAASTRLGRIVYAGISVVLILGVLATQQGGGLLLCLTYLLTGGFYYLCWDFRRRKLLSRLVGATALLSLAIALYLVFSNQQLLQAIARSLGYNWDAEALSPEALRLEIWKAAWQMFKQARLFGHGYASWFQMIWEYGQKSNRPDIVFDTAHNFFVQILVELGLLHAGLVLSILVLIAFIAFQNSCLLPKRGLLLLLAVSSFLIPALVQEIDYIRPTFYIHAIFWGTLVGLPFYRGDLPSVAACSIHRRQQQDLFSGKTRLIPSIGFGVLAGVSFLGMLFCWLSFTLGGYQFAASLDRPNTNITRWLGPSVTFAAFATAEGKAYSVYSAVPFKKPASVELDGDARGFRMTVDGKDELWLVLENGGRVFPQKHDLSFTPAYTDNARWLGAAVSYPALQSNLGIGWSRNMYPWENFAGRVGRWCGQDCAFLAKSCGRSDRLDFTVRSFRPDHSEAQPLSLDVLVYGLLKGAKFSSKDLQNLPAPIVQVREQLKNPGEEKLIRVSGEPNTAWYLVRVRAESIFNPKSSGISQDNRNLSAVISEVDCSKYSNSHTGEVH